MPFLRPTLAELVATIEAEMIQRLELDVILRRSNLGALARVAAGSAHLLHGHLVNIAAELLPDTATGLNLERWSSILGLSRKPKAKASGITQFAGTISTSIPIGTRVVRSDGVEYETVAAGAIDFSGTADVSVRAVLAGEDGNADEGTVLTLVSPIAGIQSATTVQSGGLVGGTDEESDDDLRVRILLRIQNPPQGGAHTDYEAWALEVPAVTRAFTVEANRGIGTVDVTFLTDEETGGPIPTAAKVTQVQDYIDPLRPVTADVLVVAPTLLNLDPEITIVPDTQAVRDAVEANLEDLLLEFAEPGVTLPLSKIVEAISTAPGEESHTLISPTADVTPAALQIVTLGTITWTP